MDGSCHLILLRFMMLPSLSPTPFNMVHLHTRTLIEETQNIRLYSQTLKNLTASLSFFSLTHTHTHTHTHSYTLTDACIHTHTHTHTHTHSHTLINTHTH